MKKIKYLLILMILLLPIGVSASANTKERTSENNYGVSKKWDMDDKKWEYAKSTPYVDASEKIYDFSDILTDQEEQELYNRIKPLIDEYKMEIIILTYDYPYTEDSQNSYFVSDFYDFNDFGLDFEHYSGVVFFRNTYAVDRYFDMLSFGDAQLTYYDTRMSNILDSVYPYISNNRYLEGFNKWIDYIEQYHTSNDNISQDYYVDDMGYLKKKFNPVKYIPGCAIFSIIVTLIFIVVNVKKNKMVRTATQASQYLNQESFKILEQSDKLIHSHVTSWTESDTSSSGGGGGGHSSFSGHSGGGFSSGGGRHG
ncbi:MAG: TPM domain-containing protein [Bacilli bacterium]|nr:TPM domain-containing protein [Bacilli bacterium]